VDEYSIVDTTVGLRPGSPDNAPIVGATALDGLLVATGHYRNGILLAPVTAREITRLLVARPSGSGSTPTPTGADLAGVPPPFDRFGPARFAHNGRPPVGFGQGDPRPAVLR
jgi:glycine oxidase